MAEEGDHVTDDYGNEILDRRRRMSEDELKRLAEAVAKATVKEEFDQLAKETGKCILKRLWWGVMLLAGFLALKFGIVKFPE